MSDSVEDRVRDCSTKATTRDAFPLSRAVDPRKVGYSVELFAEQFPGLEYERVLESFRNFYIANGHCSKNWFEKFLSYAQGAADRAKVSGQVIETDSMGLPTDPTLRRRFLGHPTN